MTEREHIEQQIATLEAERQQLECDEQVLNFAYWICPDGPSARAIDGELDDILDRLDGIGDEVGTLKAILWVINGGISRREKLADSSYGRM